MRRAGGLIVFLALLIPALPAHAATPTVTEFSSGIPSGTTLYGVTAASDGRVFFASQSSSQLGAISTSGTIAMTTNTQFEPVGVTSGPDGRLYYGAYTPGITMPQFLSFIGVANPGSGNNLNQWYGAGTDAQPRFTATSPDGTIRVTQPGNNAIGQIALSSGGDPPAAPTITGADPIPTSNAAPEQIVAGPSDTSSTSGPAMWFTEHNTGKIGRITRVSAGGGPPGDFITEYALLPSLGPEGIALGPDGNLWVTEYGQNKVARITPPPTSTGQPTAIEFTLPAGSQPEGIAAGPDGNMWIAQTGGNQIVRMNTSGQVIGQFPVPGPAWITPGSDGNLWFTEYSNEKIGRITSGLDTPAFQNTAPITVPGSGDNGQANTYPSNVSVSGLQGNVTHVTVRLTGISHTFPDDLDFLLQGPQGQNVMLASDAGSPTVAGDTSYPANGITLNFDQNALRSLPDSDPLVSGFFKPTNNAPGVGLTQELSPPAPGPPYGTSLNNFNGSDPNGTWKLFVLDDNTHLAGNTNVGKIFGGWGLDISTSGQLFVGKSGAGSGTVTSVPAGIDCGGTCVSSFEAGNSVVLTATPSAGSRFAQWQGCDSVTGNRCTVNVNTAIENATARFDLIPGTVPPPGNSAPTPTTSTTTKKKCKKAKKRSAVAAKKCKKRKK
jgi:Streptogramin lyase